MFKFMLCRDNVVIADARAAMTLLFDGAVSD